MRGTFVSFTFGLASKLICGQPLNEILNNCIQYIYKIYIIKFNLLLVSLRYLKGSNNLHIY